MKRGIFCGFLLLAFFCVALALSMPAEAAGPTAFESSTLAYINQYRARHGLAPLRFDIRLQLLAREHSSYMNSMRSLGHQNFGSRFSRSRSQGCAENVGWNARSSYEQFTGWRDSAGHRRNMLDQTMRRAGVSKVGPYVTFFVCM